jgi:predicted cupin superfamily sugar epimerase
MEMQKVFSAQMKRTSAMTLALGMLLALGGIASAQNVRSSVDRHTHPEGGFFETQRSARGINHARDYARDIYQYSSPRPVYQYNQGVPVIQYSTAPAVVSAPVMKSESQWLGQTIVGAQQHVAVLQEQCKSSPSKLESVKTITQHLTKAAELQKDLHMECCKETVDRMVCAMCASKIVKELDKAAAEHESLVREMEMDSRHDATLPPTVTGK